MKMEKMFVDIFSQMKMVTYERISLLILKILKLEKAILVTL